MPTSTSRLRRNIDLTTLTNLLKFVLSEDEMISLTHNERLEMLDLACKNKLLDMYLNRLPESFKDDVDIRGVIRRRNRRRTVFYKTLVDTVSVLNKADVEYTLFKTLKPFCFLPNDVDVLVFDSRYLEDAKRALMHLGYTLDEYEPNVVSLKSPEGVPVELHSEISVSYIIYLDKLILRPYVESISIDGVEAFSLSPEAELLCTIAHSVFKENIITLADYIDVRVRVRQLRELKSFRNLIRDSKTESGVYLILKIATFLEELVYGEAESVGRLGDELKSNCTSVIDAYVTKLMRKPLFPHKFHPMILTLLFADLISRSVKARLSLRDQAFNLLNIRNPHTRMLGKILVSRIKRKSY